MGVFFKMSQSSWPKATAETRPHSTVIYFLQHSVKELVLWEFFWEEWELTLTMTNPTDTQQKRKATFRPPTSKTQWRHRNLQQRNRGHGRCREGPELYRRRDPIHVIKEKQKSFSSKTARTHRTSLDVSLKATCLWATLSWQPNICIRLYFLVGL